MTHPNEIYLKVRSGRGGKGCVSFASSRRKIRGGPDGGDGGRGGDVILKVDSEKTSFSHLKNNQLYTAGAGSGGQSRKRTGKKGNDLILLVPPSTWIEFCHQSLLIRNSYRLLKGGRGGKGNLFFKTSTHQAPRKTGPGEEGQTKTLRLYLKNKPQNIGILGGSFDPPHKGHLFLAENAIRLLQLNILYIIPSYQTPNKPLSQTALKDRLQMVKDTFKDIKKKKILDIEFKRKGTSYTIDTLKTLKIPGTIFLIIGEDLLEQVSQWKNFYQIIQKVNLAICMRSSRSTMKEKDCPTSLKKYIQSYHQNTWYLKTKNKVVFLPHSPQFRSISSTKIKKEIQKGESVQSSVTPPVMNRIQTYYHYLDQPK